MKSSVKVTADKAGNVISVSKNNPEWGHIRVEQTRMVVDEKGFARATRVSALIPGKVAELAAFGFTAGQELPGTIFFQESTEPFNAVTPERDLKIAGTSGVICRIGDEPIYRKNVYSENPDQMDITIEHTNKDEVKAAYEAVKTTAMQPNEKFSV